MLQLKQAEILMYCLNDLEGARKIITPLLLSSGEEGEWARIRMGDLEFLSHNLNEATQRYGEVQNRSKAGAVKASVVAPRLHGSTLSGPVKSADFAKKNVPQKSAVKSPAEFGAPGTVADWKLSAIRDVAASETVGGLIEQGFYDEAFQALKTWERSFPLNKITGDYLLREATLYMALKDYKRARVILTAYCDQVDASNFLPEAMKMVRTCMLQMNEPEAVVDKYYKEFLKRTQFGGGE
jgi:TolA-binding protein